jgi:lysyl-tRNA synthetase class 1
MYKKPDGQAVGMGEYWTDALAAEMEKKAPGSKFIINDAKTPSGVIHVGSLRGVIIHDVLRRSFSAAGLDAEFTYEFDDMDAFDRMNIGIPPEFEAMLGMPFCNLPSPEPGYPNFARCYADKFSALFPLLGCEIRIIRMSDLYRSGKLNAQIRMALDNAVKINEINERITGSKKKANELPFQPICEKCGKIGSTFAYEWNGETVKYKCLPDKVEWAKGCGNEGEVSPFDGRGKLPWKSEWAARWPVIGVKVELAGKDHYTKTGSRAVAEVLSDEIFHYPHPYGFGYEFFLVGGRKMSTSKGQGVSAEEAVKIIPPVLLRFLLIKTRPRAQLDFDPAGYTLVRLFEEYDKYERIYFGLEEAGTSEENVRRIYELSQVGGAPTEAPVQIPFSHAATLVQIFQTDEEAVKRFGKDSPQIRERLAFARQWVSSGYCPKEMEIRFQENLPEQVGGFSDGQRNALAELADLVEKNVPEGKLTEELKAIPARVGIEGRELFEACYLAILGQPKGPRLSAFLPLLDRQRLLKRLRLRG